MTVHIGEIEASIVAETDFATGVVLGNLLDLVNIPSTPVGNVRGLRRTLQLMTSMHADNAIR